MNAPAELRFPLDRLPVGTIATIAAIEGLAQEELLRLRHLGFDEGVAVEPLHLGPIGRDPIAVRVGRMTVAIRRSHARAIQVVPTGSAER